MKTQKIIHELKEHVPFTALATIIGILTVLMVYYFFKTIISENIFHYFHFLHIIASAMVTAGIFYKYKKNFLYALLVGITGSIIIGSLSDVILPYLGWLSLNINIDFHLPLIEETFFVLLSALTGSLLGIWVGLTKISHLAHVSLSVFASLFYLLAFSLSFNFGYFIISFFIVFIAVIIPCCLSDIIFPFLFLKDKK